jgi:hypothetical protein
LIFIYKIINKVNNIAIDVILQNEDESNGLNQEENDNSNSNDNTVHPINVHYNRKNYVN